LSISTAISVGIVNYRAYAHLAACLESVKRQSALPCEVRIVDNEADAEEAQPLQAHFPETDFVLQSENQGFARAANQLIRASAPGSDVLILNADVRLDSRFVEELTRFDADSAAGILGGKLVRPSGGVDSVGIRLLRNGRAHDLRPARERVPAQAFEVFGISGAAIYLRRAMLDDLMRAHGEWFDESFWMYHEDVDIAWRARSLGWTCWTVPCAIAQHERGWREGLRRHVATEVRRHAFKNHYIRLVKNEPASWLLLDAPWLVAWEFLRVFYAAVRERDLFPAYAMAAARLPEAWRKRRRIVAARRTDPGFMRRWVEAPGPRVRP
jgi:GT2 family glycosyltransferase